MMPKRVVGILAISVIAAFTGAAGASQQSHDTNKSAPPPQPQPVATQPAPVGAPNAKFTTISRDVCAKHPNLKQCS